MFIMRAMTQPQPPTREPDPLITNLAWIFQFVLVAVANRGRTSLEVGPAVEMNLLGRITRYLMRMRKRLLTLIARIEAGTLRPLPATPRVRKPRPEADAETASRPPRESLPRHFAWLVGVIGWQSAPAGPGLEALLQDPRMQAMIAAEPRRMARVLRPLCRAFAVREWPDLLRRPSDRGVPTWDPEDFARQVAAERAAREAGLPLPVWGPAKPLKPGQIERLPRFRFYVTRLTGVWQTKPA